VLSDGDKVHMILLDMSLFAASSDLMKRARTEVTKDGRISRSAAITLFASITRRAGRACSRSPLTTLCWTGGKMHEEAQVNQPLGKRRPRRSLPAPANRGAAVGTN
jgi:hypothetical protein